MLYVIIDPVLVCFPDVASSSPRDIDDYVDNLRTWSNFASDSKKIQFRISQECRNALSTAPGYPLGKNNLNELLKYAGKYKGMTDVVLTKAMMFFNNIFNDPFIDDEIKKYRTDIKDWRIDSPSKVEPNPETYITRLPTPAIQNAYKMTLGNLACTRQDTSLGIFNPAQMYIASPTIRSEQNISDTPLLDSKSSTIAVKVNVTFTHIESEEIYDTSREISDEFVIAHSPEAIQIAEHQPEPETILDALQLAVAKYPETLVCFPLTEQTAKESNYEDPLKMYELLVGLVEVWLPVFRANGGIEAGRIYQEQFGYRYAGDESDTAHNQYAKDYTIIYKNNSIFCGRHIKIGTGPTCARINFEVIEEEGVHKIMLASPGKHGRNKRKAT